MSASFLFGLTLYAVYNSSSEKLYNCKVLETYHDAAGYKVSAKYTAVVNIIEINKNTSINLRPETFYSAGKYKKSGETVGFYFSKQEISKIKDENSDNIFNIFFCFCSLIFIVIVVIYAYKYL